jgi:hypothetical protein
MCDCCDHPLQHTIRVALATYEDAVPPLSVASVFGQLRYELEEWETAEAEARDDRLDKVLQEVKAKNA